MTSLCDCCADMSRQHVAPNTRSYNALLSACERAEQPDRALEVLLNMRRRAPAAWGYIDPNAVTFNTVMSATARAGRWEAFIMIGSNVRATMLTQDHFMSEADYQGMQASSTC